jgi:hypothetical protein
MPAPAVMSALKAVPGGSESGWGVNLTHQGDTIFASWFTYTTTARRCGWWRPRRRPCPAPTRGLSSANIRIDITR